MESCPTYHSPRLISGGTRVFFLILRSRLETLTSSLELPEDRTKGYGRKRFLVPPLDQKYWKEGTFLHHELRLGHSRELPTKFLCPRTICQTILPPNLRLAGAGSFPPSRLYDVQGPSATAALSHQEAVEPLS